jgi:hypothetical protein
VFAKIKEIKEINKKKTRIHFVKRGVGNEIAAWSDSIRNANLIDVRAHSLLFPLPTPVRQPQLPRQSTATPGELFSFFSYTF